MKPRTCGDTSLLLHSEKIDLGQLATNAWAENQLRLETVQREQGTIAALTTLIGMLIIGAGAVAIMI